MVRQEVGARRASPLWTCVHPGRRGQRSGCPMLPSGAVGPPALAVFAISVAGDDAVYLIRSDLGENSNGHPVELIPSLEVPSGGRRGHPNVTWDRTYGNWYRNRYTDWNTDWYRNPDWWTRDEHWLHYRTTWGHHGTTGTERWTRASSHARRRTSFHVVADVVLAH